MCHGTSRVFLREGGLGSRCSWSSSLSVHPCILADEVVAALVVDHGYMVWLVLLVPVHLALCSLRLSASAVVDNGGMQGWLCWWRYLSRCVSFDCRQTQTTRHPGWCGTEGQLCSDMSGFRMFRRRNVAFFGLRPFGR